MAAIMTCLCACSDKPSSTVNASARPTASSGVSGTAAVQGEQLDSSLPAATLNGKTITRGEWLEVFENYYYMLLYYYGVDPSSEEGLEIIEQYKSYALDTLITKRLLTEQAEKKGYTQYTQAQRDQAEEYVDKEIADRIAEIAQELKDSYTGEDKPDFSEQARQSVEKELSDAGQTRDSLIEEKLLSDALDRIYNDIISKASVTESDMLERYNQLIDEQKKYTAQEFTELYNKTSQGILCYIPQGYMLAQHILIGFSEEDSARVMETYQALYSARQSVNQKQAELDKAADADKTALKAQLDELNRQLDKAQQDYNAALESASAAINNNAVQIYEQVKDADADVFEETALNISADAQGADSLNVYLIGEGDNLIEEFHNAALALKADGEISAPVLGPYGYHIIRRVSVLESGPVPVEQVRKELNEVLLQEAEDKLLDDALALWRSQSELIIHSENMAYSG